MARQPRYRQIFSERPEMGELAAQAWQSVYAHLAENGLVTDRRMVIADRYARAVAEYEYHYPKAAEEGPVKVGPNGGDCAGMLWTMVVKLADQIGRYEETLLISPRVAQERLAARPANERETKADSYLS